MKRRKLKKDERILTIRVGLFFPTGKQSLKGSAYKKCFFRDIEIASQASLYELAEAITESLGFYFDHAFGFYSDIKYPFESEEGYQLFADIEDIDEKGKYPGVKETYVEDVFVLVGKIMLFYFDYGESWGFLTQIRGVRLPDDEDADRKFPLMVKSFGNAPEQYPDDEEWDEDFTSE